MNGATVQDIATLLQQDAAAERWRDGLITQANSDKPRPLLANAIHALRTCPAWAGVLRFNSFNLSVEASQATPWKYLGPWDDRQDILLAEWLQHEAIVVGVETAGQAVQAVAKENIHHPVQEYLRGLIWDGQRRLESWLCNYMGATPSEYISTVGKCALIGGVARAMNPGCKVDSMLILEGPQGGGKSQTCRVLGAPWFADEVADLGSKDAAMQVAGTWLMEVSELDAMSRSESSRIKAFLSRSVDHYRPPYGKRVIDAPRSCWFIGTTNASGYLRDETGARRFWPVRCGRIDLAELRRDRDQLFAEARTLFEAGAKWWLEDASVIADAVTEQTERFDADPWQDGIAAWVHGREYVSVGEILKSRGKDEGNWTQGDKNRVCRVMQALGWTYTRRRYGPDGTRQYVFLPPEVEL